MASNSLNAKLVICSVIIIFLVVPLLALFLVPILIFRHLILDCMLKKILRRDLSHLISPTSAVFASDGVYQNPQSVILVTWLVKGKFPIETFQKRFESTYRKLENKSDTTSAGGGNNYIFPELKQYLTLWLDYTFWKNDENFRIENHIKELQLQEENLGGCLSNHEEVLHVVEVLLKKSFVEGRSPWEFLICHDVPDGSVFLSVEEKLKTRSQSLCSSDNESENGPNETHSIIFFRMHHALGDGVSLNLILSKILPPQSFQFEEILNKVKGGRPKPFKLLVTSPGKIFTFPFKAVYEILDSFVNGADQNDWHDFKVDNPSNFKWLSINRASLKNLSRTRDKLNAMLMEEENVTQIRISTFSLILTAFTMGIRDAMEANNCTVPEVLHCACPLPIPGHSENLTNHMTTCVIALPTGLVRMKSIAEFVQTEISKIKASSLPWMGALPPNILGICPQTIIKPLSRWNLTTGIISNFPGSKVQTEILGYPILDVSTFVTIPTGISFTAICIGYNNKLSINIGFNEALFPFKLITSPGYFIDKAFKNIQEGI